MDLKKLSDFLPEPFNLLNEKVRMLLQFTHISKPTSIQKKAIPEILNGKNVLIIAPTGLGKTEAALLPIFSKIIELKDDGVKLVYVTPLKALTRDLFKRFEDYASPLGIKVRPLYGDVDKTYKDPPPDVVVITPESLEIILDISPRWWNALKSVRYVIIDEVHELVNSKRGYQLLILLERLKKIAGRKLQRIGISATVGDAEKIAEMLGGSDGKLKVVKADEKKDVEFNVILPIPEKDDEKGDPFLAGVRVLEKILEDKKSLTFVNSKYSAERIQYALNALGIADIAVHHGSITKEERELIEDEFKRGSLRCIVATKTLELGIDIGDIQQVINYRSPASVSTLLQRAGRSGHKPGEKSICYIITTDFEDTLESIAIVSLAKKGWLEKFEIEKPLDVVAKEIIAFALAKSKLRQSKRVEFDLNTSLDEIYSIITSSYPFRDLKRKVFDNIIDILVKNDVIKVENGEITGLGCGFYRIWSFDEKDERAARNFTEFFSMIESRDNFSVIQTSGGKRIKKIGELDEGFVYRSIRTGEVIRLAGKNWKVVDINEAEKVLLVSEAEEEGAIPVWYGEGIVRDEEISKEIGKILKMILEDKKALKKLGVEDKTIIALSEVIDSELEMIGEILDENKLIVEMVNDGDVNYYYFLNLFGEKVSRTIATAIAQKMSEKTLLVSFNVSPIGFVIQTYYLNPLEILKEIEVNELEKLVEEYLSQYSPYLRLIENELKYNFGIWRWNREGEEFVRELALETAKSRYYDIESAKEVLRKIKTGEIITKFLRLTKPSPLAEAISNFPYEKPWVQNLSSFLVKLLAEGSQTLDELERRTFERQESIKAVLRTALKDKPVIALLDPDSKGKSVVKVAGPWIHKYIPLTTRYVSYTDEKEAVELLKEEEKKFAEFLRKKKFSDKVVEIYYIVDGKEVKIPLPKLKLNQLFPILLEKYLKREEKKFGDLISVKVHISGSWLTIIYWNAPSFLLKGIICNILYASLKVFDLVKDIKGQLILELP